MLTTCNKRTLFASVSLYCFGQPKYFPQYLVRSSLKGRFHGAWAGQNVILLLIRELKVKWTDEFFWKFFFESAAASRENATIKFIADLRRPKFRDHVFFFLSKCCFFIWSRTQARFICFVQGRVSRKLRKLSGPAKPFLINLCLKTERCISLKLLVWRERLFILSICE